MRGSTAPPGGRCCWGTVYQGPRSLATVVRPAGGPLRLGWTSSARKHSSAGRFSGRASGSLRPAGRPGLARRLRAPGSRRDPTPFFLRSFSARQGARALPGASSPWKASQPPPTSLFFFAARRADEARGLKGLARPPGGEKEMACDPGVETPGNDRAPCRAKRKKWPVIQALKRLATIVRPPGRRERNGL